MRCISLAAFVSIQSAAAFAPAASPNTAARGASATAANLVPEQSRQLVAFSQDYFAKKAKESASKASQLSSSRSSAQRKRNSFTAVATNLVTRLVGKESRSNDETSPTSLNAHHGEGEVVYPIVGSCLVEGRALPSADQVTACNLPLVDKEEEVYGFWISTQGGDALWM